MKDHHSLAPHGLQFQGHLPSAQGMGGGGGEMEKGKARSITCRHSARFSPILPSQQWPIGNVIGSEWNPND
jgi:hypothetical protein